MSGKERMKQERGTSNGGGLQGRGRGEWGQKEMPLKVLLGTPSDICIVFPLKGNVYLFFSLTDVTVLRDLASGNGM